MPAIRAKRRDQGGKGLEVRRVPGEEMSQKTAILDMLKRGPVTPLDALSKLGFFRLAVRELREEGHPIVTHIEHQGDKDFARYELEQRPR